jgi:phosphoglycolate phosphatase-like HAD superfamily hydrolase
MNFYEQAEFMRDDKTGFVTNKPLARRRRMKIRGMIFDLDGTLLNSLPVCYSGFRSTLRKFLGREYSDAKINALFGPSEEGMLKKLLPDQWEESLQYYLAAYEIQLVFKV